MFSAGSVFLDIVPSFRKFGEAKYYRDAEEAGKVLGDKAGTGFDEGFERSAGKSIPDTVDKATKEAGDKAEKSGERAGKKFSGAFRQGMQASIKQAADDLGKGIDDELSDVQKRLRKLGKLKIGVDISSEDAVREFAVLQSLLKASADKSELSIEARVNSAAAVKDLARLRTMVEAAGRKPVTLQVRVEANQENVQRTLANIKKQASLIEAEVKIGAKGTKAASAEILALSRQVERLDGKDVNIDTKIDVAGTLAGLAALRAATRNANTEALDGANTFRSFSGILLGVAALGPLVVPALAAITGGVLALGAAGGAVGAGLGVTILGFSGLGDAVKGLSDVQADAGKDAASYAATMRNASRAVRDAEQGVADARRSASRAAQDASRQITEARRGLVEAEEQAAQDIQGALRDQADAERQLSEQQRDATRAQEDLVDARQAAQNQIQDLAFRAAGGALAERQAVLDLADARREAASVGIQLDPDGQFQRPISGNEVQEQASIDLARAGLQLREIRVENGRLGATQAEVARTGVEGTDVVVQARERLRDANRGVVESERAIRDASLAVAAAQESGSRTIAAAQQSVADAVRDQAQTQQDAQRQVRDAQERLTDAQQKYQEALVKTGELGSSSVQRLEEAMGKLGPAGQKFARFLFSLRGEFQALRSAAQAGLLPGVQEGIEIILDEYGPGLLAFVGQFGGLLGGLFVRFAEALKNPAFADFFELMDEKGGLFLEQWFQISLNLTQIILAILTAFAPMTEELGNKLVELTARWLDWALALTDSQSFQDFLDYLRVAGPDVFEFFVQLVDALINLGVALAPYAGTLLRFFTGFLDFISEMDPGVLGAITIGIIGITLAAQVLFGIASLFLSTGVLAQSFGALAGFITGAAGLTVTAVGAIIGAFLGAVVLIVVAFIFLYTHVDAFKNLVLGALDVIKGGFDFFLERLRVVGDFLASFFGPLFESVWESIKEAGKAFFDAIQPGIATLTEALPVFGQLLKGIFLIAAPFLLFIGTVFGVLFNVIINVFNAIIVPLFKALGTILAGAAKVIVGIVKLIVGVFTLDFGLMKQAVGDIFVGLMSILTGVLFGFLEIAIGIVKGIVTGIFDFFKWLYNVLVGNSIVPDMVKAIVGWFKNLGVRALLLVVRLVKAVVGWFKDLGVRALLLVVRLVKAVVDWFKDLFFQLITRTAKTFIRIVRFFIDLKNDVDRLIGIMVRAVIRWFAGLFRDIIARSVRGFKRILRFFIDLKDDTIRFIRSMVKKVGDLIGVDLLRIFDRGVSAIGRAWGALQELAKTPIRFLIETVINKGLIGSFNTLMGLLGADGAKIKPMSVPSSLRRAATPRPARSRGTPVFRAAGGLVPGYSPHAKADNIPAWLTAREYVLPVHATDRLRRRFGDNFLEQLRQGLPGYATGGIVGFGRSLQRRGISVAGHSQFPPVGRHAPGSSHYSDRALDLNAGAGTSSREQRILDALVPEVKRMGYNIIWRVADHFNHMHISTGSGRNEIGGSLGKGYSGSTGDGGGFLAGFKGAIAGLVNSAGSLLSKPVDWLKDKVAGLVDNFTGSPFGRILAGASGKLLDAAMDKVGSLFSLGDFGPGESGAVGNTGSARAAVANAAQGYGWDKGEMWNALKWIIERESAFNPNAQNPTSTAYGLFQFLNGTWAGTGYKKSSDPDVQSAAGMKYIKDRYGNPVAAKYFHLANGHYADGGEVEAAPVNVYDAGGIVPPGLSAVMNLTGANEQLAVLTPQQIQWAEGGSTTTIFESNVAVDRPAASAAEVADEVMFRHRVMSRGGVYSRG